MRTAKAAIFMGPNQSFQLKEYPVSSPKPGYAGLTLVSSGVCGTDVHIHNGKLASGHPAIIGHEFVGRIDQISPEDAAESGLKVGDCCICDIALTCGHCLLCQEGDDANCLNLGVTNGENPEKEPHFFGGYAEYLFHPVKNLIPIPENVDPKMASIFACAGPTSLHAFSLGEKGRTESFSCPHCRGTGIGPCGNVRDSLSCSFRCAQYFGNFQRKKSQAGGIGPFFWRHPCAEAE